LLNWDFSPSCDGQHNGTQCSRSRMFHTVWDTYLRQFRNLACVNVPLMAYVANPLPREFGTGNKEKTSSLLIKFFEATVMLLGVLSLESCGQSRAARANLTWGLEPSPGSFSSCFTVTVPFHLQLHQIFCTSTPISGAP